jgi:transposase
MKYIQGQNREQIYLFPICLDESIESDNIVRIIDVFVNSLKLSELGFKTNYGDNGRPAYHPSDLLKLYIYGYLNKIRSSRDLEKECKRNIEVMWLMHNLCPDHNTISNFRRDNPKAIKQVFRQTVKIANQFNLIGGTLLAGDSTKFRAQNSKKNNFNQKKIDRHIEYIDNKLSEYQRALAENDGNRDEITKEINKHNTQKKKYKELEQKLAETGQAQISTSDPDSRQMIIRNNITEVAYNVQTTTDSRHNIPIDYKTTNNNDSKAMGKMLRRAKSILRKTSFTALYDKGYHTGSEFQIADDLGIEVMVAVPGIPKSSEAPNPAYNVEHFIYNQQENTYICPQGEILKTNGTWHKADSGSLFQQFKTPACKNCKERSLCTRSVKNGKIVQRTQQAEVIQKNKERITQNTQTYRKRQAIVEHPYGTIKRQWGFSYIITKKSIQRADADVGFMFVAYNLRRLISIIGVKDLLEYLSKVFFLVFLVKNRQRWSKKMVFVVLGIFNQNINTFFLVHQKALF